MSAPLDALEAEIAALRATLGEMQAERAEIEALTGASHWTMTGGETQFDPRFMAVIGGSSSDLEHRLPENDAGRVLENWERFLANPTQPYLEQIFQMRDADGAAHWFLAMTQATKRDAEGQLVDCIGGLLEVTPSMTTLSAARDQLQIQTEQLRQANQRLEAQTTQLRQANAALEEFAYAASHDLQAPLRAIAHFASWIDEDLPANCGRQVRGHVKGLLGRVDRMVRLHADLLAYARIAGQTPALHAVRLARLVQSTWHHGEPPGGFTLASTVPDVVVRVAEASFRTVLRNLFRNAIVHHDREEGCVSISGQHADGWLSLRIEDDGPGVSVDDAQRIFNAMYRADSKRPGSGMGLAIARRHAVQAGGVVRFVPTQGRGAVFEVRWPLH